MENYSKNRGSIVIHRGVILHRLRNYLLSIGCVFALSAHAIANELACASVFPEALQSHKADGEISFDWHAQLLGNSDSTLAAVRVNNFIWSMLPSCGNSGCTAAGSPSVAINPVIDTGNSLTDYQVGYHGTATIGSVQSNSFRTITVNTKGQLGFQKINTAYRINHLELAYGATLNLAPGDYWFNRLSLASKTKINVIGEGTARVFVKESITFPWKAFANMQAAGQPFNASKLFIYSGGNVELQTDAEVAAIIYSKQRLSLVGAKLYGAGSFYHANLGVSAKVIYQPTSVAAANLNGFCGSNTVVTPPVPIEIPASGSCLSVFSNGLQTHGSTGSITFGYNAQLHNASSPQLDTKTINHNTGSNKLSCATTQCVASGQVAPKFEANPFQQSVANTAVSVPWMATATIGSNSLDYGNVTVSTAGTLVLQAKESPYHIKQLSLAYNATLKLPAGDYWIEKLLLDSSSNIEVTGAGTVRLFVKDSVVVPWMTKINGNTKDAGKFILYSYSDILFNTANTIYALVHAEGQGQLEYNTTIQGALSARDIFLNTGSHVIYKPDAVIVANYGEICGGEEPLPDLTPPLLTVNALAASTESETIVVSGTANDSVQHASGVASVVIKQQTGLQITAVLNGNNFSANVALVPGDNVFTIEARDFSGNISTGSASIKRIALPVFTQISPADGSNLTENQTHIRGQIHTLWPLANVEFFLNNTPQSLVQVQAGIYQFDVANLPLQLGENTFVLRVVTPNSTTETTLKVSYKKPDSDNDGHPDDEDLFPNDPLEWSDLDGDGVGDNSDADRDGDGISNDYETQLGNDPDNPDNKPDDADEDGIPNQLDDDRDGDGHTNAQDLFPDDASEWADLDADGIGDNADTDRDGDGFSNEVELERETDPANANDYPDTVAPLLQILNPVGERIESANFILRGSVSDPVQPHSGVMEVVIASDRFANINLAAQIDGSDFTVEVPLVLGVNQLNVTARDIAGNTTQASYQVQRIALPHFQNIVPANLSTITANTVTIAGQVQSAMPLENIRFYLNEWQITPSGTNTPELYTFSLPDVPLQLGQNTFYLRAETADGVAEQTLVLTHTPADPDAIKAPEISLISPANNSQLRLPGFRIKGRVTSHAGAVNVTVNGQLATLSSSNGTENYFESVLSFAEGQDVLDVIIEATDALDKKTQLDATFYLDNSAPQIYVHGLQAAPVINTVINSPFVINGSVTDTNLASVTINGKSGSLKPGATAGTYDFSIPLAIAAGEQIQWVINAYDLSGNSASVEYIFQSVAQATISPLLPGDNAEFLYRGQPLVIQVAARVSDLPDGSQVIASLGAEQVSLARAGTLASADITLPSAPGNYTLTYQVRDSTQAVLAASSRSLRVVDEEAIAVELVNHQPENSAINIEPNQPIELYFNKAIDASKLRVNVRETLHGNTYLDMDQPGLDFLTAKGYQLQEVHRDNQLISGSYSVLPGNQIVAFYTARQFGFNGDIRVDVSYDDNELSRFSFKIRPLPTFVIGGVADQFGQPLAGVKVSLPELDRTTVTNRDGSFAFGFQEQPGNEIPGGRHKIIINPDFALPHYGVQVRTVTLQEGRKNEVGLMRLAELHRDIPFQLITSGQADSNFAGGDLKLDFSGARLLFNNGRPSGNVQFQFMPFEQLNTALTPGLWPQWMFAAQPRGVIVENTVGIDIKMPALNGSYDYVPAEANYIVLLGYDPEGEVIEPVGIGKIENYRVVSLGKVNIKTLDYLGYAWLDPKHQPLLQQVAEGTKSMQQLISTLQQLEQE